MPRKTVLPRSKMNSQQESINIHKKEIIILNFWSTKKK